MANNRILTKTTAAEWDSKRKTMILSDSPVNRYTIAKRGVYTVQDSTGFIWGYTPDLAKAKKIQALAKKRTDKVVGIIKGNILPLPKKYKMPLKKDYKSTPKVAKSTQKNVKITPKKEAKMARKSYKDILRKNAAKGRKSQKRARELKKDSVTATMKRVKALLFRGAKGKNNGNTGYVGRIAKGKYIYRTKKSS